VSLLEVRDVSTVFDTAQGPLQAVDRVSLTLEAGETLGVVGESGSGKSVLMRTVMRLLPPRNVTTSGTVVFDGAELTRLSPDEMRKIWGKDIAIVFQNPMTSLNPVMTIGRQVAEPMILHLGIGKQEAWRRATELLDSVGIPEPAARMKSYPHELSGGQRQRVAIAMALACEPRLLIADEPTTALDVTIQAQILDLLQVEQRRRGMAMVIVTHDMGIVAGRTDRVAVMYGGRLVELGSTLSIFERTRHRYTQALIESIPRIELPSHTRLATIPGRPPDLLNAPPGCPFADRCAFAVARCTHEMPPLLTDPHGGNQYACWVPVGTAPGESDG
jgi:peptide/nickel transport system ATP-binding protein